MQKRVINNYHFSVQKRLLDFSLSFAIFLLTLPVLFLTSLLIRLTSKGGVIFKQKRVGKNGMVFVLFKFRTMTPNSQKYRSKYKSLNEVDGPVFKIYNDPRYTKIGKFLAHTGLDELPQLMNVIKGNMSLVGPRPLPIYEAKKLNVLDSQRLLIKPGITSSWIIEGSHSLRFSQWMKLDREYIENASLFGDLNILFLTGVIVLKIIIKNIHSFVENIFKK